MSERLILSIVIGSLLLSARAHADAACDRLDSTSPESSTDWQRQTAIRAFVCDELPKAGEAGAQAASWMDRPQKGGSELARALFVWQCLPDLKDDAPGYLLEKGISAFANCSVDARKLDRGALDAEIKALNLPSGLAARAIENFTRVKTVADRWVARIRDAAKLDPAYKTILIDAPDGAWARWESTYAAHKAELDLAYAVEDKALAVPMAQRSSPQHLGCEELRQAWRGYIASTRPKNRDDVKTAATDVVGFLLLERLALCDALEGRYTDAAAEDLIARSGGYWQGPRIAGALAALAAAQEVKSFRGPYSIAASKMELVYKDELQRITGIIWGGHVRKLSSFFDGKGAEDRTRGSQGVMEQGKVAKVVQGAGGLQLTFKTEKWEEPDFKCTNSGRIGNFQSDGTPVYIYHCKEAGSHVETHTLAPRMLSDRAMGTVQVGQIVKLLTADQYQGQGTTPAFVVEILDGKGARPKTVSYLGVPLPRE